MIENQELQYAVFIMFSSKDDEFVRSCVYPKFEEYMHHEINCNRELVDKDFKIGLCILNETIRCTKLSAVIVVILSDNFCKSGFCLQEFDIVFRLGKPIVLMLKGEVDIKKAPQAIKDLFYTYVRIVWRLNDDGENELMNSWINVCYSILELGGNCIVDK
ncbi:hypothetical protein DPMN_045381 [Dreissena polymorpha]|uniref:TIR domain-containing protein n=1 Tax=Dreissena polymorpha TaxID=45954 RepID=A0A9D4D697_DREPO|nr:hypothetical protein DPMN_045381 [Dreissena polymorpha]